MQYGPPSTRVRSMTFRPASAPGDFARPLPWVAGLCVASFIGLFAPCVPTSNSARRAGPRQIIGPASALRRPDTGCRRSARGAGPVVVRSARSASATCGPGRATPPDAATMASTGSASCWSGFGDRPDGRGQRQQRPQEFGGVLASASCRRRDAPAGPPSVCRCSARRQPAPGLWPPSSHSSQPGGSSAASRPCRRCSRAGHSARGDAGDVHRQAGRAQGGDRDAGVVELECARQRRQRHVEHAAASL